MTDLLQVKNLKKYFPVRKGVFLKKVGNVYAVDDVSFSVKKGQTIGLVGESGCGKTTVGRTLLRLYEATDGEVLFENKNVFKMGKSELRKTRKEMQMIFQDPFSSLNARHTVGNIIEEPFLIHGEKDPKIREEKAKALLKKVGLPEDAYYRFPFEFSGGQRQRVGIARAIALKPKLIVCDEPVSALDVSIQSQILNLLLELQSEMELSYVFIAHDLAVVRHISDQVAVMYLGKIVELTDADSIYENPLHPYTKALISAIPLPDPRNRNQNKIILEGDLPSPINPPSGCSFHTRCPYAQDICKKEIPEFKVYKTGHQVSCHFAGEL